MKKLFFSCFVMLCSMAMAQPNLTILGLDSTTIGPTLSNLIFGGCVQISNVAYSGNPQAFGVMIDATGQFGMDTALIMSTGRALDINASSGSFASTGFFTSGDSVLSVLAGFPTYDAAILEFDFTPNSDTIYASTFFFGSEEYPEYVNTSFNDLFAFFISGPGIASGPLNLAFLPGSNIPISIGNVNDQENNQFYIDNQSGSLLVFDGLTVPLQLEYPVEIGETYHFKVAIADAGDGSFDSGVFLKSQSFCGNFWVQQAEFSPIDNGSLTFQFINQTPSSSTYFWDFGDGSTSNEISPSHTYASPGQYVVTLTTSNACHQVSRQQTVNATQVGVVEPTMGDLSVANQGNGLFLVRYAGSSPRQLSWRVSGLDGHTCFTERLGHVGQFSRALDLAALPQGVYLLEVFGPHERQMLRIVR